MALDISGNVYVADQSTQRIVRFNPSNFAGTFASFGGVRGSGSGQFAEPSGVAVDMAGNIYVADLDNFRLVYFSPSDFAGTFTSIGGFVGAPTAVAVNAGNVYVADFQGLGNGRVVQYTGAATTPEPASAVLLLGGGALLALRRRRAGA